MKRKTRYLLLGFGFLVFLVLTPLITLYVTGIRFDLENSRYLQTGILAVKTEPKGASVFLNGALVNKTPASIRFLKPGEYTLSVQKQGYYSWQKRLEVFPGKVTWANESLSQLYLLKNPVGETTLATDVQTFYATDDTIVYLTDNKVVILSGADFNDITELPLVTKFSEIVPSPSGKKLLLRGVNQTSILDVNAKKLTELKLKINSEAQVKFSDENNLLILNNGGLSLFNFEQNNSKSLLSAVYAFTTLKGDLYALRTKDTGSELVVSHLSELPDVAPQVLLTGLPRFSRADIIITLQKEIVLVANDTVYKVGSELEPSVSGAKAWGFSNDQVFWFATSSELYNYDFLASTPRLISRRGTGFAVVNVKPAFGYAFYAQGNDLIAQELDSRDVQNTYKLKTVKSPNNLFVDSQAKNAVLLDNGVLSTLKLR